MIIGLGSTPSVRPILPSLRSARMGYSGHTAGALDMPSATRAWDRCAGLRRIGNINQIFITQALLPAFAQGFGGQAVVTPRLSSELKAALTPAPLMVTPRWNSGVNATLMGSAFSPELDEGLSNPCSEATQKLKAGNLKKRQYQHESK